MAAGHIDRDLTEILLNSIKMCALCYVMELLKVKYAHLEIAL